MRYRMTRLWIGLIPLVWTLQAAAAPASLDDLLQDVLKQREVQKQENAARERRFLEAREQQRDLLAAAQATLAREQARSDALRTEYEQNTGRHRACNRRRSARRPATSASCTGCPARSRAI